MGYDPAVHASLNTSGVTVFLDAVVKAFFFFFLNLWKGRVGGTVKFDRQKSCCIVGNVLFGAFYENM